MGPSDRLIPQVLVTGFMIAVTVPAIFVLPLAELQRQFWAVAAVTFVGGDSITTGLIGSYGLEEQDGYTRWICGRQPTMTCAFATRLLVFLVTGVLCAVLLWASNGIQTIGTTVLAFPVLLGAGGFAATVLNVYAILSSTGESRDRK